VPAQLRGPAPSNVEIAATALRDAIVKGRLRPGERIKEVAVAQELGISRGPIREAIRLLEHDGLLTIVPNKGALVPELSAEDVEEIQAMRAALGALALRRLILDGAELPLGQLEKELRRVRRAVEEGSADQAIDACLRYQSALVAAAGLPRVARQFEQLTWQLRTAVPSLEIRFERISGEVGGLHEALLAADVEAAERAWREPATL
jgi:DNA-binding GntR family transcriptional regulator